MLTSRFKVWRNPLASHSGFVSDFQVIHASPCPGFNACHGAGMPCPRRRWPTTSSRRHPRPHSPENCAPTFWASPAEFDRRIRARRLRIPVQGTHRHQDRHPAAEIRQCRISFIAALNFSLPAGPKQTGEVLSSSFSSPASANRAYFIARNLTFAQDQQPSKADMIKEVMGKYGMPTIVGDQHLYYIYRGGSIVSVGAQVQGSDGAGSDRQAARSESRRQAQRRHMAGAVAWPWSNARRPRRRR